MADGVAHQGRHADRLTKGVQMLHTQDQTGEGLELMRTAAVGLEVWRVALEIARNLCPTAIRKRGLGARHAHRRREAPALLELWERWRGTARGRSISHKNQHPYAW